MKYVLLMVGCLISLLACQEQPKERPQIPVAEDSTFLTGRFFIVRHAEKFPGYDTVLTEAGRARAGELYRLVKDSGIVKIYCTPFLRSIETADSLRIQAGLDTVIYNADTTGEDLLYKLSKHEDWGKKILIVAHSNTIIPIIKNFKGKPGMDSIPDNDYGNLFIVDKQYKADATVKRKRF
ncbi:histidine phosphatase superfamily protein (branch 1) [Chitinophaga skermanii]|uniref:Histidine phosphatase superfamily protein (Branch 1) n=1 Tax=Chitinophaga skermanii TaxID=331697 RepID=A0A327QFC1_9BACT|nr:histidine phosphatase family protein [Chitinophaga skermanii]RAJ02474.1 histidine phosphatase superfamily protein (branch 1) [Chitinophaga skermanii]